ncbi:hypothetical protein [Myxosarcina sp. GI1]|uniref:hypothetical protein n=1 Tax=Myxosarcina sp. GI1 TaxID=1541065 RepID=UPI00055E0635|nr:hypothetical protein [Myxosarcina sp. GI1]
MGNFHCIPESCGKVVYREYLPPVIRWKYPNEDWQEIEGDDYAIEQEKGKCPTAYILKWRFRASPTRDWIIYQTGDSSFYPPFEDLQFIFDDRSGGIVTGFPLLSASYPKSRGNGLWYFKYSWRENGTSKRTFAQQFQSSLFQLEGTSEFISFERLDGELDNCGNCIFTVYKNEQIVYQETRDVCPKVEKIDSRLSDVYKEVRVDKLSYLEGIEVVNYAKDILAVTNNFKSDIPSWCLNIYSTSLQPSIIPLEAIKYLDARYIAQICSPPTLPPPSYEVICNCDSCESCPDGTCPVECGGKICCYNDLGVSIKEIPLSNYCG